MPALSNVSLQNTFQEWVTRLNQVVIKGNDAENYANSSYAQANTATTWSQAGFGRANTAFQATNVAFSYANTAQTWSGAAFARANVAFQATNVAFSYANTAQSWAGLAFGQGNTGFSYANTAQTWSGAAFTRANTWSGAAYDSSNTANIWAQAAFGRANTWSGAAFAQANQAFAVSNTANTYAQTTFPRNKIINGNFDIWQRGGSNSYTGSVYTADRWYVANAGSTHTSTRQSFTVGQTDVPGEPTYYHRTIVQTAASSQNYVYLTQHIESCRTLAGQSGVLSFYAKADSSKNIAVELMQGIGPGNDVQSINVTTCAVTTSWQKFVIPVFLPSISGKTISANDYVGVQFWFDAGSGQNARTNTLGQQSGTFDISQVQLEKGSLVTPFEQRPIGMELSLCQRYYSYTRATARAIFTAGSQTFETHINWPVQMRGSSPTTTLTIGSRSNLAATYPQLLNVTETGARFVIQSNSTGEAYAIGEYITVESEL